MGKPVENRWDTLWLFNIAIEHGPVPFLKIGYVSLPEGIWQNEIYCHYNHGIYRFFFKMIMSHWVKNIPMN